MDFRYPEFWDLKYVRIIEQKTDIEKLAIAGALIAAEIDRRLESEGETKRS
jgi:hypothetical protein